MNNEIHECKILQANLISFQVHAEEISGNNGYVELSFCAKKLDDKVSAAHGFDWKYRHGSCFIRYGLVALDRGSSSNMIIMVL